MALVAVLLVAGPHVGAYWSTIIQLGGITAVLAAAHVVLTGWVGQLSLASPALAGIGSVVAARSATGAGLPFPFSLLAGAAAGALAAAAVGAVITGRARGVLFAAGTLAFAAACAGALFTVPAFTGTAADRTLDAPRLGSLAVAGPRYTWVVVAVAGATFAALRLLARSRLGAAMLAVREHERAAVALGIPAATIRWIGFVVTGALAGLAGALTAFQLQAVAVEQFHPLTALPVLSVAVVGGIEALWGAVLGAALLTVGPELLRELSAPTLASALPPAVLLGIVAFRPAGLASLARLLRQPGRPVAASAGTAAPSPPERRGDEIGPTVPEAEETLRVDGLGVSFGRFRAVDDMSLAVGPGEVVALIGPNGAGKTTVFDCVSGFVTPAAGRISIGSLRLDRLPATRRVRAGCGRTFQSGGLCPRLSLRDNVELALRWHRVDGPSPDELLAAAGVGASDAPAAEVPPGIARTAEIVRMLALQPRVLLLDEPTAGLNRSESDGLMRLVRDHAGRAAVLVIEHDLRVVAATDRVVVMDQGRLLAAGRPDDVRRDPSVIEAYLGTPAADEAEAGQTGHSRPFTRS
jgi:sulfate-transporting ATPase